MLKKRVFLIVTGILCALACAVPGARPAWAKPAVYPFPGMVLDRDNPQPDMAPFYAAPYASTFAERKRLALEWSADNDRGEHGAMARAVLGRADGMPDASVEYIEKRLGEREDCADFTAIRAVLALYVHRDHPFLSDAHFARIKKTLLDFKYWIDEPGPDTMISWTENHMILFHANEYLAGQMFPDEIFTNNGQTGAWHMEHARKFIMQWMDRRARWGFSEWDSNVYYSEDLGGVLALAQFARDEDVARAAAIVADLMFFDMASDMFHGVYGTSHGRTYAKDVLTGRTDDTHAVLTILTGMGQFGGAGGMAPIALCASDRYTPSDVIVSLAADDPAEYSGFERHGLPVDRIEAHGISFKKLVDLPTLFGMGLYGQPEVLDLMLKGADTYHLWKHPFFEDVGDAHKMLPRNGTAGRMRKDMEVESDRALLGEVNKVTFRTPDYMLSSAQDYRPGDRGNQQHIWQATLSPEAIVFTTNPGSLTLHDRTPCYWGGQNRLPRVAQHRNLAFILYDINMNKALGERKVFDFTHAFFPRWAFDEVLEKDNWIFGRRGDGYIALFSALPYSWKDPDSPGVHDVIAPGKRQIWISLLGNKAQYGSFEEFTAQALAAPPAVDLEALTVSWNAPGVGRAELSWTGPLTVDGKDIPLNDYKRVQNPYSTADFDTGVYVIEHQGRRLTLDIARLIRSESLIADD